MDNYLKYLDQQTEGFTKLEKLRFAYIDLGMRFSFNIDYVFETNISKKIRYYDTAGTLSNLNTCFYTEKILCKDTSVMLEIIGKHIGLDIKAIEHPGDKPGRGCHIYNILINEDGSVWTFDLQNDIKYIRNHVRTRHFARIFNVNDVAKYALNDYEIELLDRKIGYTNDEYYNNDYYRQMIKDISHIKNIENRLSLVLGNIEYKEYIMGEAERHYFHKHILELVLDYSDLEKICLITCHRNRNKKREFFPAVILKDENENPKVVYYYDLDKRTYKKITLEKFMEYFYEGKIISEKYNVSPIKKEIIKRKKDRQL